MSFLESFRRRRGIEAVSDVYHEGYNTGYQKASIELAEPLEAEMSRLREQFKIAYGLWLQAAGLNLGDLLEAEGADLDRELDDRHKRVKQALEQARVAACIPQDVLGAVDRAARRQDEDLAERLEPVQNALTELARECYEQARTDSEAGSWATWTDLNRALMSVRAAQGCDARRRGYQAPEGIST